MVDDTEAMRVLYAATLRGAGFQVDVAGDGPLALAAIRKRAPDVVPGRQIGPSRNGEARGE